MPLLIPKGYGNIRMSRRHACAWACTVTALLFMLCGIVMLAVGVSQNERNDSDGATVAGFGVVIFVVGICFCTYVCTLDSPFLRSDNLPLIDPELVISENTTAAAGPSA